MRELINIPFRTALIPITFWGGSSIIHPNSTLLILKENLITLEKIENLSATKNKNSWSFNRFIMEKILAGLFWTNFSHGKKSLINQHPMLIKIRDTCEKQYFFSIKEDLNKNQYIKGFNVFNLENLKTYWISIYDLNYFDKLNKLNLI